MTPDFAEPADPAAEQKHSAAYVYNPRVVAETANDGFVYYLKNTMEDTIIDEVAAALKHMPDACKCGKCFFDICAIALNSFPSNYYATSEQGELFKKVDALLNLDMRKKISGAVFDAIEKVKNKPDHEYPVYDASSLADYVRR